jgi:primase-polymerase (primpol)-like protein
MEKPRTYNGDLKNLSPALLPLTAHERWVVWPWELRTTKGGRQKWTKPPRQVRNPSRNARSNDPSTWGSYTDAVAAVDAGNADGIGYMLKGSDIGAIDLDHCVDKDNDTLVPWAERLQNEALGAYQEITVSGGGLRIIGKVNGPETQRKFTFDRKTGAGIELYRNTARYITISGIEMGGPCVEGIKRLDVLGTLTNKFMRTYTMQVEALARKRHRGEQNVTVRHLHVHSGAQAVVGVVNHGGRRGGRRNGERAHEPEPAALTISERPPVRSADQERQALPVASDQEGAMSLARRGSR